MDRDGERAFEAFVAASGPGLLRAAYLMSGGGWADAEDLVQTVLERVARRWGRLSGDPESYARVVLAHAATDRWRRRKARPVEISGDPVAWDRTTSPDLTNEVDDRLELVGLLRDLPAQQRTVLVLRYFYDLSEADAAATLGISVGAVKSSSSRALAALRARGSDSVKGLEASP